MTVLTLSDADRDAYNRDVTADADRADAILRPGAADAADAWRVLVEAEREQVEALPNRPRPEDFYGPIAEIFKADPRRRDEPLLNRILDMVRGDETWMDIGAGGGRYALPIALSAKSVVAVEPSAGMRMALGESAAEHGIANIEILDERWPCKSRAPVADVALICHVGYDIAEMGAFLDQMEAYARRMCVAVMFEQAPISEWAPLWRAVHGEERRLLPGIPEFMTLLFARRSLPQLQVMDLPPRKYESRDRLQAACRRPLWVLEDTPEDDRLRLAIEALALEQEGGLVLNPRPRRLGIITWESRTPNGHAL